MPEWLLDLCHLAQGRHPQFAVVQLLWRESTRRTASGASRPMRCGPSAASGYRRGEYPGDSRYSHGSSSRQCRAGEPTAQGDISSARLAAGAGCWGGQQAWFDAQRGDTAILQSVPGVGRILPGILECGLKCQQPVRPLGPEQSLRLTARSDAAVDCAGGMHRWSR
jgi:hypothetical protein